MDGTDRNSRLIEQVHDPHAGRRDPPPHHGDVDLALLQGTERVVGANEGHRCPGFSLESSDRVLCPRIGQQPAETEADARLPPDGAESALQLGEDSLDVAEERASGGGRLHVPRTAVQQRDSERVLELSNGAAQRGLGDAEFVGGAGERAQPRHRLEHPQVPQFDSAARRLTHAWKA